MVNRLMIAKKPRAAAPRQPKWADEKFTGPEPNWESARKWSDEEKRSAIMHALTFYNYYFTASDMRKYVVEFGQQYYDWGKAEISAFAECDDNRVGITIGSVSKMILNGAPMSHDCEFITNKLTELLAYGREQLATKRAVKEAPKRTVKDHVAERLSETIGELEGHYDEFIKNPNYNFKPYDFLVANNVPQSQLTKYEAVYQARFDELKLAVEKTDEQITEGYSHYKAADFKRIMAFIDQILNDIIQYRGVKKATKKVRVKKAPSKEKVVAKLKFAKEDKGLKLVSVNPADIIGAQELWVYNVKTRKLGRYIADTLHGPLNVKGTSIIGFDENKSVCKTLRKPDEKLKEFARATKVQLRKFIEDIKATETKLNGRINSDIVLLRVQ